MEQNESDEENFMKSVERLVDYQQAHKYLFRVCLLGDAGVGKTSILTRFCDNSFKEKYNNTIGVDFRLVTLKCNDIISKIHIWDTAGQERFRSLALNYLNNSHGIILIYDITNTQSFENVKTWVNQIREEASSNVIIYIAGNKVDMEDERKVDRDDGEKLAEELGFPFVETSAKNGININETFEDLVERIDKVYGNIPQKPNKNKLYKAKKRTCC